MRATLLGQPSNTELSEEELAQVRGGIFRYAGGVGNQNGVLVLPLQAASSGQTASRFGRQGTGSLCMPGDEPGRYPFYCARPRKNKFTRE
jgi:hypothetical protein